MTDTDVSTERGGKKQPVNGGAAKRGPGRPPEPGIVERRRRELVEAAYRVFARRGYAQTGVADIVEELGVGRGTFYRYFDNKRDILVSVLDYGVDKLMSSVFGPDVIATMSQLDESTTGEQLLEVGRIAMDRLCSLIVEDPGIVRVVLFELSDVNDELTVRLFGLNDIAAKATESILVRAAELGIIRSDFDLEMVARLMNTAFFPAVIETLQGTLTPERQKRIIDTAVDMTRCLMI